MSPIDGNLVSDDFVRRTSRVVRQVERWRGRNPRRLEDRLASTLSMRKFRVQTEYADYVEAFAIVGWPDTLESSLTLLAKPPDQREDDEDDYADKRVNAVTGISGGTGVFVDGVLLIWEIVGLTGTESGPGLIVLKFSGSRIGRRYLGTSIADDGSSSGVAQFRFPNDPGIDNLLDTDDYVLAIPCPTWDEGNTDWSGTTPKYWAILSPWAAWG